MVATIEDVTGFWREAGPEKWFTKDDAFDTEFRSRFLDTHFAAARRELDDWLDTAEGSLALMILLDQFPRNCFRGTGHMYATDPLARCFARKALDAGHDKAIEGAVRVFFYMPFGHSEDAAHQEEALLHNIAMGEEFAKHARRHREIIDKFGRFPHRNTMLGRDTTPEEKAYLDSGGFAG